MDLVKEDMAEKCKHLGVRTKLNSAQLAHSMYTKQLQALLIHEAWCH
jgi:hypothetical protein